jgi:hypothetical protein
MIWLFMLMLTGAAADPPATSNKPSSVVAAARALGVEAMLASESRRIRSGDERITQLIVDGVRRSPTFADLVAKIHQSNVIVYVEPSLNLLPEMDGRTMLQAAVGADRYLRVQVRATLQGNHLIAVMAHEFRHTLEVADDPSVVDDRRLADLYRRIGNVTFGETAFDTEAARAIGKLVRDELSG